MFLCLTMTRTISTSFADISAMNSGAYFHRVGWH